MLRFTLTFLVLAIVLQAQTLTRTQVRMGTFISISLDSADKKYFEKSFEIIRDVELSLSSYNPQSPIYKLNRDKKTQLDAYSFEALRLSKRYHDESSGYFDITVGSITKDLYAFGEKERVPETQELEDSFVDFGALEFTPDQATLQANAKVDLGGMGKGFGVDRVSEYLKKNSILNAVVSASGDIRCLDVCRIEVQNPFGDGFIAAFNTVDVDMGVSTSGNYNRYVKSTKHNHLIDPKSKASQKSFVSITLISHLASSDLDAYATAASVMPIDKAYEFLNSKELAYIVIQSDKELLVSANINRYAKDLIINKAVKK